MYTKINYIDIALQYQEIYPPALNQVFKVQLTLFHNYKTWFNNKMAMEQTNYDLNSVHMKHNT